MPFNSNFLEAFLLSLPPPVGEALPLLLLMLRHGHKRRHPVDPLLRGEAAAVVVAVAVVDGVGGVEDHKCPPTHQLRGPAGEVVAVAVVPILGHNLLPRLFIITPVVVVVLQPP